MALAAVSENYFNFPKSAHTKGKLNGPQAGRWWWWGRGEFLLLFQEGTICICERSPKVRVIVSVLRTPFLFALELLPR